MLRILFFVFIAFAVWFLVRSLTGSRKPRDGSAGTAEHASTVTRVEDMRQCAWCGAHVPASDAVAVTDGRIYCSTVHRDAALASSTPRG